MHDMSMPNPSVTGWTQLLTAVRVRTLTLTYTHAHIPWNTQHARTQLSALTSPQTWG